MSIEIKITNRQPSPGVLNLFSHERDSRVIEFVLENYRYNEKDLSKYKAYVSTAVNGKYDLVELTSSVVDGKLKVIWNLRDYTFPQTGAILYQLCFKGDGENATAYYTYKAVIVNRETLDAEHRFPCDYPTIMQQWIDHMHTLSREFGSNITYMLPGESIPVGERLDGRVYYQWLDIPTSRATAATGTVNLGNRPHADSGLYINDVHVYVDDSDNGVYVIDPTVWVNTINNADCGVFATDISAGDEIILLLTAKNVGASGNTIGLKLDVALYGDGKGETNPSGGHVSGSTLTGGSDASLGDDEPRGRFEDANGNILHNKTDKHVDYSADRPFSILESDSILDGGLYVSSAETPTDCVAYVHLHWSASTALSSSDSVHASIHVDDQYVFDGFVSCKAQGSANTFPVFLKAGQKLTLKRSSMFKDLHWSVTALKWGS